MQLKRVRKESPIDLCESTEDARRAITFCMT